MKLRSRNPGAEGEAGRNHRQYPGDRFRQIRQRPRRLSQPPPGEDPCPSPDHPPGRSLVGGGGIGRGESCGTKSDSYCAFTARRRESSRYRLHPGPPFNIKRRRKIGSAMDAREADAHRVRPPGNSRSPLTSGPSSAVTESAAQLTREGSPAELRNEFASLFPAWDKIGWKYDKRREESTLDHRYRYTGI